MIDAEPQLEVVDTAQSQEELLHKAFSSQPDLIVTHYGLTMSGRVPLFRRVFGEKSSLLLMVSQNLAQNADSITSTLEKTGFANYSSASGKVAMREAAKAGLMTKLRELVNSYSASYSMKPKVKEQTRDRWLNYTNSVRVNTTAKETPLSLVVIGASTGGSAALEYLIRDLSIHQPTVVLVAVHMPEKFTKRLARRLQKLTHWRVEEGFEGMRLTAGTIVIAPGGQNMRVQKKSLHLSPYTISLEPSSAMDTPSVDVLMESAAHSAKDQVLGVILTGMGQDGTAGAQEIVNRGGLVIAQNEETSTIFGMAKSAIESGVVSGVFPLGQINAIMHRFVMNRNLSHVLQQKLVG
ncbi:CheB methylesterase domain-containing protein [Rufibacter sediminis]|uniref:protein-glutamate methylesterase n=1 Tax=Rufibacter sediminis TaxID=2762756 RepID=A0ABR6VZP1_9BACT|nr:CheB methylesterase domain-containing protein [Rufibacter sediminis]MBC3542370.1 chemotaxis protein CheB [Rufibacter sediminis]